FAALGVRHPVAGGVSAYVREGLGDDAAAVTGGWLLAAVLLPAPAVSLIGGYYLADLTGSGTVGATIVGLAMFATGLAANAVGLPGAMALAFGIVTVVYIGLAVATIGVTAGTESHVPLADLMSVGFGRAGGDATAVLAVALTMGTMNVYLGGAAKLAAALAAE